VTTGLNTLVATTVAASNWALIGRIGDGPPFEIGSSHTEMTGSSGRLYLAVNGDDRATYPGSWAGSIKKRGKA
jgi:hypothetical protein